MAERAGSGCRPPGEAWRDEKRKRDEVEHAGRGESQSVGNSTRSAAEKLQIPERVLQETPRCRMSRERLLLKLRKELVGMLETPTSALKETRALWRETRLHKQVGAKRDKRYCLCAERGGEGRERRISRRASRVARRYRKPGGPGGFALCPVYRAELSITYSARNCSPTILRTFARGLARICT